MLNRFVASFAVLDDTSSKHVHSHNNVITSKSAWDLTFSIRLSINRSSCYGLWRHVVLKGVTNVSEKYIACIFRVKICLQCTIQKLAIDTNKLIFILPINSSKLDFRFDPCRPIMVVFNLPRRMRNKFLEQIVTWNTGYISPLTSTIVLYLWLRKSSYYA